MRVSFLSGVLFSTVALAGAVKQHDEHVVFVSADANAKTITVKMADGKTSTGPLLNDAAIKAATMFKPGDKVGLTCDDDDKGQHVGVSKLWKDM